MSTQNRRPFCHSEHVVGLYCSESPELGEDGGGGGGGGDGGGGGGPRELRVVQLRGVAGKSLGVLLARWAIDPEDPSLAHILTITITITITITRVHLDSLNCAGYRVVHITSNGTAAR